MPEPSGGTQAQRGKVLVLVCRDLSSARKGLDLEEVASALLESDPAMTVEVVDGLCQRPEAVQRLVKLAGPSRLVIGACSVPEQGGAFRRQARKAGLDPFGVLVVELGHLCVRVHPPDEANEKAKLLLAGAAERARAFPGTTSQHLKVQGYQLGHRVSRRDFLTMLPLQNTLVPRINDTACVASIGCDICLRVCPQEALQRDGGSVRLSKEECVACGRCVGECPVNAIEFPQYSFAELTGELRTLLTYPGADLWPRATLFTCQKSQVLLRSMDEQDLGYPGNVLPVALPCLAMATPYLLLLAVHLGSAAVGLLSCGSQCAAGAGPLLERRVVWLEKLLVQLGLPSCRLKLLAATDGAETARWLADLSAAWQEGLMPTGGLASADLPECLADLVMRMAVGRSGAPEVAVADDDVPLGVVDIDPDLCTACGLCATRCPTGALVFKEEKEITLSFDAARCTGCGACAAVCPERERGAIAVRRVVDVAGLRQRRAIRVRDYSAVCTVCGRPFIPKKMLRHIQAGLERRGKGFPEALLQRCPDCRVLGVSATKDEEPTSFAKVSRLGECQALHRKPRLLGQPQQLP
ncbi:MAG: 4Fe-4S binding protein [Chloroflexi bacterium]|nr:4Fe-4S binding protein [Chloroflexota bacterium]